MKRKTRTETAPFGAANPPETRQNSDPPRAPTRQGEPTPAQTERRTIQIDAYQPHPRNYNRHPADQIKRITHSLSTFGQVRSIVVWRGYFLAGHGVAEAARTLGWTTLQADVLPDDYPEIKALAYLAADNELSRLSDPDAAQLAAILQEARAEDAALMAAIGYDDAELRDLLARIGALDVDTDAEPRTNEADRLAEVWQTQPGQIWQAGGHRIACGDNADPDLWRRLMQGEKGDLLWTDPPYGVDYAEKNKMLNALDGANRNATAIESDLDIAQAAAATAAALTLAAQHTRPGAAFYMATAAGPYLTDMIAAAGTAGWGTRQILIWVKNRIIFGRQDYHYQHEPILYGWKPDAGHTWIDVLPGHSVFDDEPALRKMDKKALIALVEEMRNERRTDVIRLSKPPASPLHPTTKPTQLVTLTARNNTRPGDILIDPFAGSGTTLIAAEQMQRRARVIEIHPPYAAVILQRYQDATGDAPTLISRQPAEE